MIAISTLCADLQREADLIRKRMRRMQRLTWPMPQIVDPESAYELATLLDQAADALRQKGQS